MKKLLALFAFSVLLLVPLMSQDVFASHTDPGTGTTGHCDITANPPVPLVDYSHCDLSNANLSNANLAGANLFRTILFRIDFTGTNLSGADISQSSLTQALLSGADLSNANLSGTNLGGNDFTGTILSGANLSSAILNGANLSGVNLSGVNLFNANLSGADLSNANLSGVNLSRANLSNANLSGANFSNANLSNAILSGSSLSGADFSGADFTRADLSGATNFQLGGVTCGAGTTESLPDAIGIKTCAPDFAQICGEGTHVENFMCEITKSTRLGWDFLRTFLGFSPPPDPTCTPTTEICDGLDNNCDGSVDEGNPGGGGACNTGLAGVCAAGTNQCSGGTLACVENVAPSAEVCDGLDNNCDGSVDEGNTANESCNDGLFCTGPELCQGGMCVSSGDPCAGNVGDNDADCSESCDEAADSCTANDPVSVCSLGFCDGDGLCLAPVCGNGIVEPGEQCDDGNQVSDDDCTNSCLFGGGG